MSAITGLWAKLVYIAELRAEDGTYRHWGHSRVHGDERSQAALARMHSELYIELLRTSIRDLHTKEDKGACIGAAERLHEMHEAAIPTNLEGGSPKHFNSLLLAVRLLNAAPVSTHPAASPPQLPDR